MWLDSVSSAPQSCSKRQYLKCDEQLLRRAVLSSLRPPLCDHALHSSLLEPSSLLELGGDFPQTRILQDTLILKLAMKCPRTPLAVCAGNPGARAPIQNPGSPLLPPTHSHPAAPLQQPEQEREKRSSGHTWLARHVGAGGMSPGSS